MGNPKPAAMPEHQIERAIGAYIALRDQVEKINREAKKQTAELKEKMRVVQEFVEKEATRQGVDSFSVRGVGTAFWSTRTVAKITDWDQALAWIRENEAWEMLQKRVSTDPVREYEKEEHALPSGITLESFREMKFNRK